MASPYIKFGSVQNGGLVGSVKAGSSFTESVYAYAANGSTTTPSVLRYRIDNSSDGSEIKDWTALTPANPTALAVSAADNALVDSTKHSELHWITVEATYSDATKATGQFQLKVEKMRFLSA